MNIKIKKAFTLIEVIIALIISAMIGVYILKQKMHSNFKDDVENFGLQLVKIISTAVMDDTIGYANGSGGSCSDNKNYFDGITAKRVIECIGWDKYNTNGSGDSSYIYGVRLLGNYTNGVGCKIYLKTTGSNTTKFNLFVDCSEVEFDNKSRYKEYVEGRIEYILKLNSQIGDSIESIDRNATDIDGTSGGSDSLKDGKILIKFDTSLH